MDKFYKVLCGLCACYDKEVNYLLPFIEHDAFTSEGYGKVNRLTMTDRCSQCSGYLKSRFMEKFKTFSGKEPTSDIICLGCENREEFAVFIHENKRSYLELYKLSRLAYREVYYCSINIKKSFNYVMEYINGLDSIQEIGVLLHFLSIFPSISIQPEFAEIVNLVGEKCREHGIEAIPNLPEKRLWWMKKFAKHIAMGNHIISKLIGFETEGIGLCFIVEDVPVNRCCFTIKA